MERASRGGIVVSSSTLDQIQQSDLDALGVVAKRIRRQVFATKSGIPPELAMYRLETRRESSGNNQHADVNS
jgi:hypothetical protein